MKKLSLALALVMIFSTFASPLAVADVEGDAHVYSDEGIQSVEVAIENGTIEGQIVTGEDAAVIINQDIDGSIYAYNGINLVINGQVISPIGMAAVSIDGEGNIVVNGNVENTSTDILGYGLDAFGGSHAEIAGDVLTNYIINVRAGGEGTEVVIGGNTNSYVVASDGGSISIGGNAEDVRATDPLSALAVGGDVTHMATADQGGQVDISGDAYGTISSFGEDSSVTVGGNVNLLEGFIPFVNADDGGEITVEGNVNGGSIGASGIGSQVTVKEDATARIYVEDATVTVGENLNGTAYIGGEDGLLTVGGNVEGLDGATAVNATNGGTAEIGGNVTGGDGEIRTFGVIDGEPVTFYSQSMGVSAVTDATVTVDGDVSVGEGYIESVWNEDGSGRTYSRTNVAVEARDNSDVVIKGDVTTGKDDSAILAYYASTVNVKGEVNGGKIVVSDTTSKISTEEPFKMVQVSGEGSQVTVGGGTVSSVKVTGDGSSLEGVTNVDAHELTGVYAWGDVTVKIDNNVTAHEKLTPITLYDGSKVISHSGGTAIYAGDKAEVTVGGNVVSDSENPIAIVSYNDASIVVDGNVEGQVSAGAIHKITYTDDGEPIVEEAEAGGASVVIGGSVNSEGNGVIATDGASIEVHDGITAEKNAITSYGTNTIQVEGDVDARTTGIKTSSDSNIDVQGNVTSEETGLSIYIGDPATEVGSIVVNGVVNAKQKAVQIEVDPSIDVENAIGLMPQVIVQTLESEKDLVVVTAPEATEEEKKAIQDSLIDNLYYIVNTEKLDEAKVAIYGTEVVDGYVVAKEDSTITVKSTDSGYIVCNVQAGQYASVTENADGSYTIKVNRGGDLNISADVKAKENTGTSPSSGDDYGSPVLPPLPDYTNWTGEYDYSWPVFEPSPTWFEERPTPVLSDEYFIMPDYQSNILTVNMTTREEVFLNRSDLETFLRSGVTGVNFVTPTSSFYMSMAELISLFGGSDQCMVSRTNGTLQIWVFGTVVLNIDLVAA